MSIRVLGPEDVAIVPAYVKLFRDVLDQVGGLYDSSTLIDAKNKYSVGYVSQRLVPNADNRFVGHFSEGDLDGLLIEGFDNLDGQRTTINWVMARSKGSGVGSRLVLDCVSRARCEGKDNVSLAVSTKNVRARALYEKLGFVSGGFFENKYGLPMEIMGFVFP